MDETDAVTISTLSYMFHKRFIPKDFLIPGPIIFQKKRSNLLLFDP
jgi:hypothetical protein